MAIPRPVPPYDSSQIAKGWWYCLDCCHSSSMRSSVEYHLRSIHGCEVSIEGEDYTNGDHLLVLLERWRKFSLLAVDRFRAQLDSLRGADDFVVDVGDGVPDA